MQNFAVKLIAASLDGKRLKGAVLDEICTDCVTQLKDAHTVGASTEAQSEMVGKALENVKQLMADAIARARPTRTQ
jgi:hypothetical protein